ncbi:unnamed protein product, partial [Adineta steineri]
IRTARDKDLHSEHGEQCASETIENIRTVVALHQENHFINTYEQFFNREFKKNMCRLHITAFAAGVAYSLKFFINAATYSYGSTLIRKGEMSFHEVYRYKIQKEVQ